RLFLDMAKPPSKPALAKLTTKESDKPKDRIAEVLRNYAVIVLKDLPMKILCKHGGNVTQLGLEWPLTVAMVDRYKCADVLSRMPRTVKLCEWWRSWGLWHEMA
ncbi:MAG: hypothetical protein ACYCWN_11675, partial [Ferrimicrobium sp.]